MQNVSGFSFGSNVGTGIEGALLEAEEKAAVLAAAERVSGWIASRLVTRLSKIRTGLTTVYHGNVPPVVADLQEIETRLLNFTVWRS